MSAEPHLDKPEEMSLADFVCRLIAEGENRVRRGNIKAIDPTIVTAWRLIALDKKKHTALIWFYLRMVGKYEGREIDHDISESIVPKGQFEEAAGEIQEVDRIIEELFANIDPYWQAKFALESARIYTTIGRMHLRHHAGDSTQSPDGETEELHARIADNVFDELAAEAQKHDLGYSKKSNS